jgi:hypothetical protein
VEAIETHQGSESVSDERSTMSVTGVIVLMNDVFGNPMSAVSVDPKGVVILWLHRHLPPSLRPPLLPLQLLLLNIPQFQRSIANTVNADTKMTIERDLLGRPRLLKVVAMNGRVIMLIAMLNVGGNQLQRRLRWILTKSTDGVSNKKPNALAVVLATEIATPTGRRIEGDARMSTIDLEALKIARVHLLRETHPTLATMTAPQVHTMVE